MTGLMLKMPLVEHIKSLYPSISLDNVLLIGCQHILGTTHAMIRSLYDRGLDPKNVYLLGKCYSTNEIVWKEMTDEGIFVSPLSFSFDPEQPFDHYFENAVSEFASNLSPEINSKVIKKIILIDDGGEFIKFANKSLDLTNIVGIEQTTSGYEKIKCLSLRFPVINVARSPAKLVYESPMIAEVIARKIKRKIRNLSKLPKNVLILGNGAIGSAVFESMKSKFNVVVYDSASLSELSLDDALSAADLIIGCTGATSLPKEKHHLLKKGCILLSASSSDRELDAACIRKGMTGIHNCHNDISTNDLLLLNCGFPVNFDGERHSVPPSKIQLTRALLVSAILQAVDQPITPGIVQLDAEMENDVISKYLEIKKSQTKPRAKRTSLFMTA